MRNDRGEGLIELIVAMAILGTTAVAILAGFSALAKTSGIQKDQGKALAALSAGSEYAKSRSCGTSCAAEMSVSASSVPHDADTTIKVSAPAPITLVNPGPNLTQYVVTVISGNATLSSTVVVR